MTPKILHLTLFRRWFDEILQGEKTEEYRDIKPYWTKRLLDSEGRPVKYTHIIFKNGYQRNAPEMRVEFKGLRKDPTRYTILLGRVLEVKNVK